MNSMLTNSALLPREKKSLMNSREILKPIDLLVCHRLHVRSFRERRGAG